MSSIPEELKYASTHEWVSVDDEGLVTVGISDHAQDALGEDRDLVRKPRELIPFACVDGRRRRGHGSGRGETGPVAPVACGPLTSNT